MEYMTKISILNIHENILSYQITYENKEELIEILKEIPEYNSFSSDRLISFINHVKKRFKQICGKTDKIYWIFGREYSDVLYIEFFTLNDISELLKYIKHVKHYLKADEFNVYDKNGNIQVRLWWD